MTAVRGLLAVAMVIAFILGALALDRFRGTPVAPVATVAAPTIEPGQTYIPSPSVNVHEFALRDGTRCVVAFRGGITCDWKRP